MTIDQRRAARRPANSFEEEGDYDDDIGGFFDEDAGALEEEEVDVEEEINVLAEGDVEGEGDAEIDDAVLETLIDPHGTSPSASVARSRQTRKKESRERRTTTRPSRIALKR